MMGNWLLKEEKKTDEFGTKNTVDWPHREIEKGRKIKKKLTFKYFYSDFHHLYSIYIYIFIFILNMKRR